MLRVILGAFLVAHSIDLLRVFIGSNPADIIACLVVQSCRLRGSLDLFGLWINHGFPLVCRDLPILILCFKITEILGSWTHATVVQASIHIAIQSADTSDDRVVFAVIPSEIAADESDRIIPIATRFQTDHRAWSDALGIRIAPHTESVVTGLTVVVAQSTFERALVSNASVRSG